MMVVKQICQITGLSHFCQPFQKVMGWISIADSFDCAKSSLCLDFGSLLINDKGEGLFSVEIRLKLETDRWLNIT